MVAGTADFRSLIRLFQHEHEKGLEKISSYSHQLVNMNIMSLFQDRLCSYCQTYDISRTLAGNKIVDHSYAVGASHANAAPTTSSFST